MVFTNALDAKSSNISDNYLLSLFAAMESDGYCCIPEFIDAADLIKMQEFVASSVAGSQNEYVAFQGSEAVHGSGLDELAESSVFKSIFTRLYEASRHRPAPPVQFYQLLRCLTGKGMNEHSFNFHYDSYLITALIPIVIPTTGRPGDLYILPNTRPVRKTYAGNLLDKLFLDNKIRQKRLRRRAENRPSSFTRISMVPGNLYLFWGYRSIHTNEPCDPGTVRATALYHYFDPHVKSKLKARLRK